MVKNKSPNSGFVTRSFVNMPPKVSGAHIKPSTRTKANKAGSKATPKTKAKVTSKPPVIQSESSDMARQYNCKKCLTCHEPPTGAKCTNPNPTDMSSTRIEDGGDNVELSAHTPDHSGSITHSNSRHGEIASRQNSPQDQRDSYQSGYNSPPVQGDPRMLGQSGPPSHHAQQDYYGQGGYNGPTHNHTGAQAPPIYPTQGQSGSVQYEFPPPLRRGYQPPPPRDLGPSSGAYPPYASPGFAQHGFPPPLRGGYQPPNPRDLGPLAAAFGAAPPTPLGNVSLSWHESVHGSFGRSLCSTSPHGVPTVSSRHHHTKPRHG